MLFKNVASQKAAVFAYDKTTGAATTGASLGSTARPAITDRIAAVTGPTNAETATPHPRACPLLGGFHLLLGSPGAVTGLSRPGFDSSLSSLSFTSSIFPSSVSSRPPMSP